MVVRGRRNLALLQNIYLSAPSAGAAPQSSPKQDENRSSCRRVSSDGFLTNEGSSEISLPGTSAYTASTSLSTTNLRRQFPADAIMVFEASPVLLMMTGSVNPALTRSCDQVSETSAHPDSPNPNRASRIMRIVLRVVDIIFPPRENFEVRPFRTATSTGVNSPGVAFRFEKLNVYISYQPQDVNTLC